MAAPRLGSVPNTPLFSSSRYQHTSSNNAPGGEETRLPTGRCNFTNLSVGENAPRCGCRRFWDKAMGTQEGKSGFCMCEHHACYHDDFPEGYTATLIQVSSQRDVVMSDGSSTIQNTPLRHPQPPSQPLAQIRERDERERDDQQEATIPDTAQWGRYVHSGHGSNLSLPAIPSQCLLPSETGSVTSGCGSAYLKPFGGFGSRALSHIPTPSSIARAQASEPAVAQKEPGRSMQIYEDAHGNGYMQSLTEMATPSVRTSQDPNEDLGQNIASVKEALDRYADARVETDIALRPVSKGESVHIKQSGSDPRVESLVLHNPDDENLLPRIKHVMGQLMDYPNKIQNHEQRIEQLENVSFSNGQIDDLRDDYDRVDTRVGDLEEKVHDLDRQMASINDGSICGRQHISSFDGGAISSSAMIASAIDRVDPSRVEALEAQVAELQASAVPSHARPWEVEVVFLPFGSRLMGIWSAQPGTQRSRLGSTMTDEWTQTQHSLAAAQKILAAHDLVTAWERSATGVVEEQESTWLMARACGLQSRVDERLRSRGLVKLIQICGTEARDFQAAITKAFGDLPDIIAEDPYTLHDQNANSIPKTLKPYLALSSPFIPLRKIHKNSCLRFLTPSEMVTPALWTVPFLSSSVAMRHAKVRRLYVTHRDSYIQHLNSHHDLTDWTWQKLRQLPRVYPDQVSFDHTPEADAHEPCWEFDDRLDPPHESFPSSISSHISQLSIQAQSPEQLEEPASPSDHFSSAAVSTSPTSVAPQSLSPLKERRDRDPFRARPSTHGRTISMPSIIQSVPIKSPHFNNKRRITSFDHEHQQDDIGLQIHSSPSRATSIQALQLKRRRTRSPSKDPISATPGVGPGVGNGVGFSRFSAGPPSPYTFVDELGMREMSKGKDRERDRDRGMTPFAYATPHSNAPYIERDRERSGAPISVYEDESVAGDENIVGGEGEGEEESEEGSGDDMDVHDDEGGEQRRLFEAGMGMGTGFEHEDEDEDDDKDRVFANEGSIDLDLDRSLQFHERQIDEEYEWEGVVEEGSPGRAIGAVVEDPIYVFEDESDGEGEGGDGDEDDGNSSVPSEYPSTQQRNFGAGGGDGELCRGGSVELGFRIHVDEDEDEDDEGDDELV